MATALHADADVQEVDALLADQQQRLIHLVPQRLGLHQLQRGACGGVGGGGMWVEAGGAGTVEGGFALRVLRPAALPQEAAS